MRMNNAKNKLPTAVSQNYFGNDVSEISSQSMPSNKLPSPISKKQKSRRGRKEINITQEADSDQPPEKLKEEVLRPPNKEENGNFELFWQVIRKQEEPPYQSSNHETVSEVLQLS